jgi:putative transposase
MAVADERRARESASWQPVTQELLATRRDLPHLQVGGATYFITFRLCRPGESARWPEASRRNSPPPGGWPAPLTVAERAVVRDEILYWHGSRWHVHMLTVMPDHVHILATPLEVTKGHWYSLTTIVHSLKVGTARKVNRLRGRQGRLWQSERLDRIVASQAEFEQKSDYILDNATRAGLTQDALSYDGFWCESMDQEFETKLGG